MNPPFRIEMFFLKNMYIKFPYLAERSMKFRLEVYRFITALLMVIIVSATASSQDVSKSPVPSPKAVVEAGNARFTVLTPQLVRMEWSKDSQFIDSPSLLFINRNLEVPPYTVSSVDEWLVIKTDKLELRYKKGSGEFKPSNLQVSFLLDGENVMWHPGDRDTANLGGTTRTLDGAKGSVPLDDGLVSKTGWTIVDDTKRPLFDDSSWPWAMPRPSNDGQDWYFFGYGHDYKKALGDFVKVAGRIPMPPHYAFGTWWSRYWAYTDVELKDIVNQFSMMSVPLNVLVVDMDWHLTFDVHGPNRAKDQAGQSMGWTGYTWDTTLFPNHVEFLKWCHDKGLKTVLNLHPASGIQPWETSYPAFAKAMGVNPASKKYIPFDLVDKKNAENYFDLVLHPLEREGVDFWWIDWQQWDTTSVPNLGPTWWLNYAFYTDMARGKNVRPLILARWGGLGDHRYQIGFSGDVISDWSSLQFQPYFTSTAANVGFGYWSHDIGGHIPGAVAPELYTRWVQWGALSPILRTHTTKNPEAERRIWAYPYQYFRAMRNAFTFRQELLPYIYTSSRKAYDSGISMIHPLYYEYPNQDQAYKFADEYFFGDDLLVSPVVHPMSPDSLLATERIWIPPGSWIEWNSGERLTGPQVVERHYSLEEIPIFVRSGSIIPMQSPATVERNDSSPLILRMFPDSAGSMRFYEDDGTSDGYRNGQSTWTLIRYNTEQRKILKISIGPSEGQYAGMEQNRSYEIHILNTMPPARVFCEGTELHFAEKGPGWKYNGDELSTVITMPAYGVQKSLETTVEFKEPISARQLDGIRGKIVRLREAMDMLNSVPRLGRCPDTIIKGAQTGDRLSLFPNTAEVQLKEFKIELLKIHEVLLNLPVNKDVVRSVLNHLSDVVKN